MKTPEQIKLYLIDLMYSMSSRPKMYADTPLSFETQFLSLIDIKAFIDGNETNMFVYTEWRKFAKEHLDYSGTFPVATYLEKNGKLDENWGNLADLLIAFRYHILSVPVPA